MALIKQGKGRTITRYSNLFNIGNKLFQTVQFFRQLQFTKKTFEACGQTQEKKTFSPIQCSKLVIVMMPSLNIRVTTSICHWFFKSSKLALRLRQS